MTSVCESVNFVIVYQRIFRPGPTHTYSSVLAPDNYSTEGDWWHLLVYPASVEWDKAGSDGSVATSQVTKPFRKTGGKVTLSVYRYVSP